MILYNTADVRVRATHALYRSKIIPIIYAISTVAGSAQDIVGTRERIAISILLALLDAFQPMRCTLANVT